MSILDGLLGGNNDSAQQSSNSNDFGSVIGTDPAAALSANDLLHSTNMDGGGFGSSGDSSDFTGLGSLGAAIAAPTVVGVSSSSDHSSTSVTDGHNGGGLLNGLT